MFPDFRYILKIINVVNKNKLLTILEAFLRFCVLSLKKNTPYISWWNLCVYKQNLNNLQRKKSF